MRMLTALPVRAPGTIGEGVNPASDDPELDTALRAVPMPMAVKMAVKPCANREKPFAPGGI